MTPAESHSIVLAADYRVRDLQRMWSDLKGRQSDLAGIGARFVVMYASSTEPGRVLTTVGVRSRAPVERLLRSPAIFEWFDSAGVEDIPPIFAGEIVEKISAVGPRRAYPPGVLVSAMAKIDHLSVLMAEIHSHLGEFARRGVRELWVYQAFDDDREVMLMHDTPNEHTAGRWIDSPDENAVWMRRGSVEYPSPFVGRLFDVMRVDPDRRDG